MVSFFVYFWALTLSRHVKPGQRVSQFDPICEVQSDKAAVEITSRFDGVITATHYKPGEMAKVGQPLIDIDVSEEDGSSDSSVKISEPPTSQTSVIPNSTVFATPAVRRIAKENNVDLSQVQGTGKENRILKEDVIRFLSGKFTLVHLEGQPVNPIDSPAPATPIQVKPSIESPLPLTAIQKAMFKSMTKSLQIPHFGFSEEIVMNECSKLRSALNSYLKSAPHEKHTIKKISYMPILLKAMSIALKNYPVLNASLINSEDVTRAQLLYRNEHNIGIAIDSPQG
jgi:2-oxoisovalerate dehydrogenase E2 component (dihydrolipoyl transacylase)